MTDAHEHRYTALAARDARFDGVFYVGVTTTGVYCRPICPARLPRADRCEFFTHAAAAEQAGFRACLRCRPELAPGFATVDARTALARRAARQIQRGALNSGSVADLATGLGVSSRHLRRVLAKAYGVTPVELAQTHRLGLAKRLLHDTNLPMTVVAHASGFGSVRRFNASFRAAFARSPTELRRGKSSTQQVTVRLDFRPPMQWELMLAFIAGRAVPGVVTVNDGVYVRTLQIADAYGSVRVRRVGEASLEAAVSLELIDHLPEVIDRLRVVFDLDSRPDVIATHFAGDALLGRVVQRLPGLRVPGAIDGFEIAVRTVLGQQVSVAGATTLSGRFAETFGVRVDGRLYFPRRGVVANATLAEVQAIGMPTRRAQTLIDLAASAVTLDAGDDPMRTRDALLAIRGIGPWTANYVAMRALRWPDAYPENDLILERRGGTVAVAERWRPWRSYAAMYLWNRGEAE